MEDAFIQPYSYVRRNCSYMKFAFFLFLPSFLSCPAFRVVNAEDKEGSSGKRDCRKLEKVCVLVTPGPLLTFRLCGTDQQALLRGNEVSEESQVYKSPRGALCQHVWVRK